MRQRDREHGRSGDVGLASNAGEDVDAVHLAPNGDLFFSCLGTWAGSGGSGDELDVGRFAGVFGPPSSGSITTELDLTALGIPSGENLDGVTFQP